MLELDNKYLENLHTLIEESKDRVLSKKISALHPTDIARVLNQLKRDDVHYASGYFLTTLSLTYSSI